jgi:hypothetical protein
MRKPTTLLLLLSLTLVGRAAGAQVGGNVGYSQAGGRAKAEQNERSRRQMYDSYIAGETEAVSGGPDRTQTTVQSLRKSRTFYDNPLNADGFDRVIDPVVLEPVVQFTLYLKLKYEIETRR